MTRDKLQKQATSIIIDNQFHGIMDISPRFGKSKVVIDAIREIKKEVPILIIAPYNTILESWKKEFIKWKLVYPDITLLNQRSLSKIDVNKFPIIISDECHSLSPRQLELLKPFKGRMLGLSGSISEDTKMRLGTLLKLPVVYKYGVDEAVKDKIVADYEINIITLPLDATKKYIAAGTKDKPFKTTEAAHYKYLTRQFIRAAAIVKKDRSKEGWLKAILGKRARAVYSYQSKLDLTKKLLSTITERTLVFTTLTTNDLVPYKHDSKTKEDNLQKFIDGKINQLQVCNMVSMGKLMPL